MAKVLEDLKVETETLLRNSDYYISGKGYLKIPRNDENSLAEWKKLEEKYNYLLAKVDPITEERWVKDYLKNNFNYMEITKEFGSHIKAYQEAMLESHHLTAQITGIRDVLEDLEVEPDPSLVKSLIKKIEKFGSCLWKVAHAWLRAKDWSCSVKPDNPAEYWYGCSKYSNNTIITNFYMQDEDLKMLHESLMPIMINF